MGMGDRRYFLPISIIRTAEKLPCKYCQILRTLILIIFTVKYLLQMKKLMRYKMMFSRFFDVSQPVYQINFSLVTEDILKLKSNFAHLQGEA